MKLLELNVYGFGKWKDFSMSLAPNQVNVVTGKNEAGKSTLYQFILFMLFGLSPKQREAYLPKTGGTMGGQLLIETEEGDFVWIERIHDRNNGRAACRMESGEEFSEEWLQHLLGATDKKVYESIFSFNADDLLRIQNLTGENIGEILLNIGLTGSDQIYQTEKWLDKNIDERFKPKGKKPEINEQLQRVEYWHEKKRAAENEEAAYQQLHEEKQTWSRRLEGLEHDYQLNTNQLYRTDQLLKSRPVLVKYHQTKAAAEEHHSPVHFPESGKERYQQIKEILLPLESEKRMLDASVKNLKQQIDDLEVAGEEDIVQGQLLLDKKPDYDRAYHEYDQLGKRKEQVTGQLEKDMQHMDVPVEMNELEDYPLPFYIEETWRDLKNDFQTIESEEERLHEQLVDMERDFENIEDRKAEIENERISEEQAVAYEKQVENAYQTAAASADRQARTSKSELRKRRTYGSLGAIGVILIGGFIQTLWFSLGFLLFTLLVAGILIGISYKSHKNLQKQTEQLDNKPTLSFHALEEARRQLQQYEKCQTELNHLHDQWKQLNQEEIRLEEKRNHLLQRKRRVEAGLDEQKSLYPFLSSLHIEHWEKLYHLLNQAREKRLEYQQLTEVMDTHAETLEGITQQLKTFYLDKNWIFYEKNIQKHWQQLSKWVSDQEHKQGQRKQLAATLNSTEQKLKENEHRLRTYLTKKEELFQQAGVQSEEEFYKMAKLNEDQETTLHLLTDLEQQIKGMLSEAEQDEFDVWHTLADESELHASLDKIGREKQRLEEDRKLAQQSLADTISRIKQLEDSEKRSEIAHRLQVEQNRLQEQAKEWAHYQIALQLLRRTKRTYKNHYLPQVMETAESHFKELTSGNYVKINLIDQEIIQVVHQNGTVYTPEELSRGTRDQLYVAFRIGLGETMAGSLPLPFLVDDAFVHFDEDRLKVMLDIFEGLAACHQVILFSWRKDVHSLFRYAQLQELQ